MIPEKPKKKKPVREIMIPVRRDFMGDLGDWVAESPENAKEFDAMLEDIFEDVARNRKARGEAPPPSGKRSSEAKKKPFPKKSITTKKTPAKPRRKKT